MLRNNKHVPKCVKRQELQLPSKIINNRYLISLNISGVLENRLY